MTFVVRSLPRGDRDEALVLDQQSPRSSEDRDVTELEHCPHCGSFHGPDPCEAARWDQQMEQAASMLAELRARGAIVTLRGETVNVRGVRLDDAALDALRAVKPALVAILTSEAAR